MFTISLVIELRVYDPRYTKMFVSYHTDLCLVYKFENETVDWMKMLFELD